MLSLAAEGFLIERSLPDAVEATARRSGAEAIIIDADLPGALQTVARVRRSEGVVSTVPILFIGRPGERLRTSHDALDAGGDAFLPRPISVAELTARLRALLELPSAGMRTDPPMRVEAMRNALPPSIAPPLELPHDPTTSSGISSLSPALAAVLRSAAVRAGGDENDLALPSLGDDSVDDLIPPELLEPLDAPLDALVDESLALSSQHTPPPHGSPGAPPRRSSTSRMPSISARGTQPTPTITPLSIGGETRLSGSLGPFGAGFILGAASRSRASGLLVVRSQGDEYRLSLTSGHVLAIRSSRSQDDIGALLARLGSIPLEAARFALAPLDTGLRGAALVAARGYLTADALAQALSRAARELVFDLVSLPHVDWEMLPLENAAEIPLNPRSIDALLVQAARARLEPEDALSLLGGPTATVALRAEPVALASLPLSAKEREAIELARGTTVQALTSKFGEDILPAIVAVAWLGLVRTEGGTDASLAAHAAGTALAADRTRLRALADAATARDYFALLGVSEWTTRSGAREALGARRAELDALRSRHGALKETATIEQSLVDVTALFDDAGAWKSYVASLRART